MRRGAPVGAQAQRDHRGEGSGGHARLIVPRLGRYLTTDHVADGGTSGAQRGIAGESVGLGEEAGVEQPTGGWDKCFDPGQGGPSRNCPPAT